MPDKKAEDWIKEWNKMDEEFVEEGTMFRLDIPSVKRTEEWMKEEYQTKPPVHKGYNED